jgi:hypothetical protein
MALAFEQTVACMAAQRPKFFSTVVESIDPELFSDTHARTIVTAAQLIYRETGNCPSSPVVTAQRLARMHIDGKLTEAAKDAAIDLLIDLDIGNIKDEEIIDQLRPVMLSFVNKSIARAAIDAVGSGNFKPVRDAIDMADKIGRMDSDLGVSDDMDVNSYIRSCAVRDKLTTGIMELDILCGNGGTNIGTLETMVAKTSGGKSMWLVHRAKHALRAGRFTGIVTLELNQAKWLARLYASFTGIPTNLILNETMLREACGIMESIKPNIAPFVLKYMNPVNTKLSDIQQWVEQIEQRRGRKMDVLVVDYLDKIVTDSDATDYKALGRVFEGTRVWMEDTNRWGITASQPKRQDGKNRLAVLTTEDLSDSQNKARIVDYIFTANRNEENHVTITKLKDRHDGNEGKSVGPYPSNFACAQIVPDNAAVMSMADMVARGDNGKLE